MDNAQEIRQVFAAADALVASGDVITASEVARLMEVAQPTVNTWMRRDPGFPKMIDAPSLCGQTQGSNYRKRAFFVRSEFIEWAEVRAERIERKADKAAERAERLATEAAARAERLAEAATQRRAATEHLSN